MDALTLDKAFQLHDIIGKYLPENDESDDVLDFIGTIIEDINSDRPHLYIDAIILMSGRSLIELEEASTMERVELFATGLSINKVLELEYFCRIIGHSDARS